MRHHAVLCALIGSLLLFLPAPGGAADRALVVGVDHYPSIIRNGVPGGADLAGAVVDARTFTELLVEVFGVPPSSIAMLTDKTATRDRILQEFRTWLIDGSKPGDRVFFYFAGHGARVLVAGPGGTRRLTSTIAPFDTRGDLDGRESSFAGMIQGTEVRELLRDLEDRHVTVVVDACFSGSISRGRRELTWLRGMRTLTPAPPSSLAPSTKFEGETDPSAARLIAPPRSELDRSRPTASPALPDRDRHGSLAVWSAATIAQVTFDHPEKPGGIFTQSLASRLRETMKDPSEADVLTASSLLTYVRAEADRICRQLGRRCSNGLTPELLASKDYLLSVLAPAPKVNVVDGVGTQGKGQKVVAVAQIATSVLSHVNDFELSAEVLPSRRTKVGDEIRFRIRSSEAGTLVVLDVSAKGELKQIFPNRYSERGFKGGRVRAGATIVIPDSQYGFAFEAAEPGPGTLIALVADDETELQSVLDQKADLSPARDPSSVIAALASRLQEARLVGGGKPNGRQRWSFAAVPYMIDP